MPHPFNRYAPWIAPGAWFALRTLTNTFLFHQPFPPNPEDMHAFLENHDYEFVNDFPIDDLEAADIALDEWVTYLPPNFLEGLVEMPFFALLATDHAPSPTPTSRSGDGVG